MRDDPYDEALGREAERYTAEDLAAAARLADAAAAMLGTVGDAIGALVGFERRLTLASLRRGLAGGTKPGGLGRPPGPGPRSRRRLRPRAADARSRER